MDKFLRWILTLAPFLAQYPSWVRAVFAVWVGLGAVLVIALVLARSGASPDVPGSLTEPSPPRISTPQENVLWLVIDGIEFFSAKDGAQVRVVANINGTEFLYPSRAGVQWLEVGPAMSSQVFKLPPTQERYIVRFEASVRVPTSGGGSFVMGQLKSIKEQIIEVPRDIPFNGRYILHTYDPVHQARSASAQAQLKYRITPAPN